MAEKPDPPVSVAMLSGNGPEIPLIVGSARPFVYVLHGAVVEALKDAKRFNALKNPTRPEPVETSEANGPFDVHCLDLETEVNPPAI